MRRAPLAALLLSLLTLPAAPASAWVRSRSTACNPVYWPQTCVYIQPDSDLTADMPAADVERIIQQSIAQWQIRTSQSFMKLIYVSPDGKREARLDRQPTIKFRTGRWCRPGDCSGDKESCYDASAAAITTVFFVNKPEDPKVDGQILDADIEMNSVVNRFYEAIPPRPPPASTDGRALTDLENTLVHELGHLQGLDHTCRISANDGTSACTKDDKDRDPPLCSTVKAKMALDPEMQEIFETTMFASADPGETKKRTPEVDDVDGVVASAPLAGDPKRCDRPAEMDQCPQAKGCSAAALTQPPVPPDASARRALLGLLAALGLASATLIRHRLRSRA